MEDEMKVKVKDHVTPRIDGFESEKSQVLLDHYSHHVGRCSYCGHAHLKDYVCSCGYDHDYNDEGELIWRKVR